ncbi:MAG: hypothetical protein GY820_07765 [Gammaproteobacteria bacterium]|nr:hypothetical protein [Gammaproteobacteria bacterium]
MSEYKLKFTEKAQQGDGREETLNELIDFIKAMEGLVMTIVTLDDEQSENWDKDGGNDFDYQDYYGKEIVQQIQTHDPDTQCVVIRNTMLLPVAMAANHPEDLGWQGIGVDKRLRNEVRDMISLDDYELEEPI